MNNPMQKALAVVKQGTAKALDDNVSIKKNNASSLDNNNTKPTSSSRKRATGKRYNPYNAKYQSLVKRGFKYSTNQLAKYVYQRANPTKYKNPNRRIKKLMYRQHNRLVLSHLSSDNRWDLPCVSYHGTRYYYVNALQYVYLIARSHRGCAVGLRNAMAEIAQSIVTGGISANAVIRYAHNHRGGING